MLTHTLHSRVRSVRVCYSVHRCPTDVFGVREPVFVYSRTLATTHALRTCTADKTERGHEHWTLGSACVALLPPWCSCAERASSPVFGCTRTPGSRTPNTSVGQRRSE